MAETVKLLENIADDLKNMSKEINAIAAQLGKAAKAQSKPAAKSKAVKKAGPATAPVKSAPKKAARSSKDGPSIVAAVLDVIRGAEGGIDQAAILLKTGLGRRQVSNAIFKLKVQQKVKNVGRGVYAVA
ncbi:MAG: hypothetical protein WAL90_01940 [Desulfobacterales bacterium]